MYYVLCIYVCMYVCINLTLQEHAVPHSLSLWRTANLVKNRKK